MGWRIVAIRTRRNVRSDPGAVRVPIGRWLQRPASGAHRHRVDHRGDPPREILSAAETPSAGSTEAPNASSPSHCGCTPTCGPGTSPPNTRRRPGHPGPGTPPSAPRRSPTPWPACAARCGPKRIDASPAAGPPSRQISGALIYQADGTPAPGCSPPSTTTVALNVHRRDRRPTITDEEWQTASNYSPVFNGIDILVVQVK